MVHLPTKVWWTSLRPQWDQSTIDLPYLTDFSVSAPICNHCVTLGHWLSGRCHNTTWFVAPHIKFMQCSCDWWCLWCFYAFVRQEKKQMLNPVRSPTSHFPTIHYSKVKLHNIFPEIYPLCDKYLQKLICFAMWTKLQGFWVDIFLLFSKIFEMQMQPVAVLIILGVSDVSRSLSVTR